MSADNLSRLIDAIGGDDFEVRLQHFPWEICSADHFDVFHVSNGGSYVVGVDPTMLGRQRLALLYKVREMWRRDPLLRQAMELGPGAEPRLVQMNLLHDVDPYVRTLLYHTIRDRYLLYGRHEGSRYASSVMRSEEIAVSPSVGIGELLDCAALLLAVLAKHYERVRDRVPVRKALSSLEEIERRINRHASLPAREAAVCARLAYGMLISGIALDLGISEESVKTYRKRLYRRLSVSSARELLVWYLELGSGGAASWQPVDRRMLLVRPLHACRARRRSQEAHPDR